MSRPLLIVALLLLPLAQGCVFSSANIRDEIDTISWDLRPMELESEVELQIGRGILGLAGTVARWTDDSDAEFAADLLDDIETIDIGVYALHGHDPGGLTPDGLEELRDLGWRPVVRTSERRDGARWVLYRSDGGLDEMLVVGIEDQELVVLRLTGHLGGLLDNAIRREDDLVMVARVVHDDF
ncbi:hypothetical protein DRQ53_14595 [bacterium]|nr:MAG: hypothetical protein DRQ53_14595 [bacterium]